MKSDGVLYFEKDGEYKPLVKVSEIEATELAPDTDLEDIIPEEYRLSTAHEFSFSLGNAPQFSITLYKLMCFNNYRRLHGLKPIRCKAWRHKPKLKYVCVKSYKKRLL